MDFKEFTTRAEQDIRAALEDASPGVGVGMNPVEKLQGESYTAITLTPEGTNIGMNLNLNQLYDRMQRGESYDSVLQAAVDQAKEHLSNMPRFDVAELSSYETAKDLLFVDVVGTKVNAEMLAKVPHTDMEDISMVYRMQLEQLSDGAATVLITNDLMNRMGVTKEQLHADAMANSEVVRPASMRTMAEVMAQMMGMSVEDFPMDMSGPQMYVVTNVEGFHGSAAAFYPDFMDNAAKELGGNLAKASLARSSATSTLSNSIHISFSFGVSSWLWSNKCSSPNPSSNADFAALYSSALPTYSSFLSLENASILSALRCS